MRPQEYLETLTSLRERVERSQARLKAAEAAERDAKVAIGPMALEFDRADEAADPAALAPARAAYHNARAAHDEAVIDLDRARASAEQAARDLAAHEGTREAVFKEGLQHHYRAADLALADLGREWSTACEVLMAVARKVAALERAAGMALIVRTPQPSLVEGNYEVLGDRIGGTFRDIRLPLLGKRASSSPLNKAFDADRARKEAPADLFAELAAEHDSLYRLARHLGEAGSGTTRAA